MPFNVGLLIGDYDVLQEGVPANPYRLVYSPKRGGKLSISLDIITFAYVLFLVALITQVEAVGDGIWWDQRVSNRLFRLTG